MNINIFEARFERTLLSEEFAYLPKIEGYFEKKLRSNEALEHFAVWGKGTISQVKVSFERDGYTLIAHVTYRCETEMSPPLFIRPKHWKAVYDPSMFNKRIRIGVEKKWGREATRKMLPYLYKEAVSS